MPLNGTLKWLNGTLKFHIMSLCLSFHIYIKHTPTPLAAGGRAAHRDRGGFPGAGWGWGDGVESHGLRVYFGGQRNRFGQCIGHGVGDGDGALFRLGL